MLRKLVCALLALALSVLPALAMDRDALRAAWREAVEMRAEDSPYAERPDVESFALGSLTDEAQSGALALVNLLRALAGLDPVTLDPPYALRAPAAAASIATVIVP